MVVKDRRADRDTDHWRANGGEGPNNVLEKWFNSVINDYIFFSYGKILCFAYLFELLLLLIIIIYTFIVLEISLDKIPYRKYKSVHTFIKAAPSSTKTCLYQYTLVSILKVKWTKTRIFSRIRLFKLNKTKQKKNRNKKLTNSTQVIPEKNQRPQE